jgi:hypothetical protein
MADRQPGMVDTLSPHQAQPKVTEMVVVGRRDRQLEMSHAFVCLDDRFALSNTAS